MQYGPGTPATLPAHAEIAVVGGGPAGASVATMLARAGRDVWLFERLDGPRSRVGETLPPHVRPVLEQLGMWPAFLGAGHLPTVGNRSCWGSFEPREADFIFSPYGAGWHIDRGRFQAMLLDGAAAAGAHVVMGTSVGHAEATGDGIRLGIRTSSSRRELVGRFVIDASGRALALGRNFGLRRSSLDHLVGIVGYLETESPAPIAARATLIEAVEDGWWYAALLPDGRLVATYMTDADQLAARDAQSPNGWEKLVRASTHVRSYAETGGYHLAAAPVVVPANTALLGRLSGASWVAVGDAAASYDPLSSQGILSALSMGIRAAAAVNEHLDGDRDSLERYSRETLNSFARYLAKRDAYYAAERRWPSSVFWRRRRLAIASR